MRRQPGHREPPADDRASIRVVGLLALATTAAYLIWRTSQLGRGPVLGLSIPLLAAEVWAGVQLAGLTYQGWRLPGRRPLASANAGADRPDLATRIVVVAVDAERAELERTLVGCRLVAPEPPVVVLDGTERADVEALAASFGAEYRSGFATGPGAVAAAVEDASEELIVWLAAGEVPMPDLVEKTVPRFADPAVAVVQVGVDLLNPDSLSHQQRGRDEAALMRSVIGPGLARRGWAPWAGSASVLRRDAIATIEGFGHPSSLGIGASLVDLHRRGWRTDYDPRPLIRATAPDTLDHYLGQRRRLVAETLGVVRTTRNPVLCRRLPLAARLAHLSMLAGPGSGIRQLLMVGVLVATLVSGRLPFTTSAGTHAVVWASTAALATVARRGLGRGSMAWGDWVRQAWRTVGADVAGVSDFVKGRSPARGETPQPTGGLEALGRLRLLAATVIVLDGALLIRSATLLDPGLLPAFTTTGRLVVVGAGLAALVPMIDVLQMIVRRTQRRAGYRLSVEVPLAYDGGTGYTVDLDPAGAGAIVDHAGPVGTVARFRLDLPRIDGGTDAVTGTAETRWVVARPDGRIRVGIAFRDFDDEARRTLIRFCTVDQGRPRDRRRARRIEVELPIRVGDVRGHTVDLTPNGIGLRADRSVDVGTELRFELELPRSGELAATVGGGLVARSSIPLDDGRYRIGAVLSSLDGEARAALIRYCAIDHRRLSPAGAVPISSPGELEVELVAGRRRALRALTAVALALGAVTFSIGPASAAAGLPTVCVRDAEGGPISGATVRWRSGTADWSDLGTTDGSGCLPGPPTSGMVDIEATHGHVSAVISRDVGIDPNVVFGKIRTAVCVTDSVGAPIPGAQIRYFGGGWRIAGTTDGTGRRELEHLPADLVLEAVIGGDRYHLPVAGSAPRAVSLSTIELTTAPGSTVTEIDSGTGWRPFVDGTEVLPGRIAARLTDGTVVKLEAVPGHGLILPSGAPSSIVTAPDCALPATTTPTTAPLESTTLLETTTTTAPLESTTLLATTTTAAPTTAPLESTTTTLASTTLVDSTSMTWTAVVQSTTTTADGSSTTIVTSPAVTDSSPVYSVLPPAGPIIAAERSSGR